MTYLSRCAQLVRDLRDLNVIEEKDSVYFYLDDNGTYISLEVYFHGDEQNKDPVRNNDRLVTIKDSFFQEFPELLNTHRYHLDEDEIFFVKK